MGLTTKNNKTPEGGDRSRIRYYVFRSTKIRKELIKKVSSNDIPSPVSRVQVILQYNP